MKSREYMYIYIIDYLNIFTQTKRCYDWENDDYYVYIMYTQHYVYCVRFRTMKFIISETEVKSRCCYFIKRYSTYTYITFLRVRINPLNATVMRFRLRDQHRCGVRSYIIIGICQKSFVRNQILIQSTVDV